MLENKKWIKSEKINDKWIFYPDSTLDEVGGKIWKSDHEYYEFEISPGCPPRLHGIYVATGASESLNLAKQKVEDGWCLLTGLNHRPRKI